MNCDIDIKKAVDVLKQGGVILYPTDTIWGLGCDARNADAVRRIYAIKKREDSKAMICLVDSPNRLQKYFRNIPEVAWDLIDYAERPLTLILDNAVNVAPNLVAEDGSLGMRVTKEQFSQQLCFKFQSALVSTSANISGQPSPKSFYDIPEEITSKVDYIVQFARGRKSDGRPSSIIKLTEDGSVTVIRR
jgi:L-threonylcarbamoyladenylate synthase